MTLRSMFIRPRCDSCEKKIWRKGVLVLIPMTFTGDNKMEVVMLKFHDERCQQIYFDHQADGRLKKILDLRKKYGGFELKEE